MRCLLSWAMAFATILVPIWTYAADPTLADIERAWKEREKALKSGRIEWTEHTLFARGSIIPKSAGEDRIVPNEDISIKSNKTYIWDLNRMKYHSEGRSPESNGTRFVPTTVTCVCGGSKGSRTLRHNTSIEFPRGLILKGGTLDPQEARENVELIPVLLWLRPLDVHGININISSCRLLPEKRRVGGRDCVVLRKTQGMRHDEWAVDIQRNYIITRYELIVDNKSIVNTELDYTANTGTGWSLSKWHTVWLNNDGGLSTDRHGNVTTCVVGESADPSQFELEFPRGTWVNDTIRNLEYILTSDGSERIVTQGEILKGIPYRELLQTASGLGSTTSPHAWRRWVLWSASLTLVAVMAMVVLKRLRPAS